MELKDLESGENRERHRETDRYRQIDGRRERHSKKVRKEREGARGKSWRE